MSEPERRLTGPFELACDAQDSALIYVSQMILMRAFRQVIESGGVEMPGPLKTIMGNMTPPHRVAHARECGCAAARIAYWAGLGCNLAEEHQKYIDMQHAGFQQDFQPKQEPKP